jgi:hypothetical protein
MANHTVVFRLLLDQREGGEEAGGFVLPTSFRFERDE